MPTDPSRRRPGCRPALLLLLAAWLGGCVSAVTRDQIAREIDPETLVGLAPAELTARLGEPELRRREAPVEVWQYRSDRCVLDLYLDAEPGAPVQVVYYEARHRAEGDIRPARCLGEIVAEAASAPSG